MQKCKLLTIAFVLSFSGAVLAQDTVGELLDAGATKASKQNLVSALAGSKVTGITSSGRAEMNIDLKPDGTLSGNLVAKSNGSVSGTIGKWWVDDDGKACVDERLIAWNMDHKECWYTYVLGTQTFRTISDTEDRGGKVRKTEPLRKAN